MFALACLCLLVADPNEQARITLDACGAEIRPIAVDAAGTTATFEMRNRTRATVHYLAFTKRTSPDGKYAQPWAHVYRVHEGKQHDIGEKLGWCGSCNPIATRPLSPGKSILFDVKLQPGSADDVLLVVVRGDGEVKGVKVDMPAYKQFLRKRLTPPVSRGK